MNKNNIITSYEPRHSSDLVFGNISMGIEPIPPAVVKDYVCNHHEHNPPQHLYIPAGKSYKHICPACSKETVVNSLNIMC